MTSQLPVAKWHDTIGDPTIADADYVGDLSPDATATILDGLDVFTDGERAHVLARLCRFDTDEPLLGSIARHRAAAALDGRC